MLVLNNDTQAATNLLRELHDVLVGHPRMGTVAPCSNHVKGDALLPVGDAGKTAAGRAALRAAPQRVRRARWLRPTFAFSFDGVLVLCRP